MFADDISLVGEMVVKYGLQKPFGDLGGLRHNDVTVADYRATIESPTHEQHLRYQRLDRDPFCDVVGGDYLILNPAYGDPPIEYLPSKYPDHFGIITCMSVLEHVLDPFEVFHAFRRLLKPGGILILSTVFSFPLHDEPRDFWRFSDKCLEHLASNAGLDVLESGFRLKITGDMGVQWMVGGEPNGIPQEIFSTYVCARKKR